MTNIWKNARVYRLQNGKHKGVVRMTKYEEFYTIDLINNMKNEDLKNFGKSIKKVSYNIDIVKAIRGI